MRSKALIFLGLSLVIILGLLLTRQTTCRAPTSLAAGTWKTSFNENSSGLKIIARVLNTRPFVIEVLDVQLPQDPEIKKQVEDNLYSTLGIKDEYSVAQSEDLNLQFNDIITATKVSVDYGMLFSTEITDIQKITGDIVLFNPPSSRFPQFTNRSGRLLQYKSPIYDNITIFNDGTVFYEGRQGGFGSKTLTPEEISELMHNIPRFSLNILSAPFGNSVYKPHLIVLCNGYKRITLFKNPFNQSPIVLNPTLVHKLNDIINGFRSNTRYVLTYKQKYELKDWPYGSIVHLQDLSMRQVDNQKLSMIEAPSHLFEENRWNPGYYRENGRIYGITGFCAHPEQQSWACIGAEEIKTTESALNYRKRLVLWPQELGISLNNASPSGLVIPKDEYNAHKVFYDTLPGIDTSEFVMLDKLLVEGDWVYDGVWILQKYESN